MKKVCKHCGEKFESKREDAVFCSDSCRKAFGRDKWKNVRDNAKSARVKPMYEKNGLLYANNGIEIKKGICHGCGKKVNDLTCICLKCVNAGITHESIGIGTAQDCPMCEAVTFPYIRMRAI
ncbi:MAG: hypothetical protein U9M90_01255 [Patescibacteria group bacterium]|nr:hypothetical protein [Patescibacteria group bacterium]